MRRLGVVMLLTAFLVSACSALEPDIAPGPEPTLADVEPVRVERGAIVSVVTAPVIVVATPEYTVPAPATGTVSYPKSARPGAAVAAGAVLAYVNGAKVKAPTAGIVVERVLPSTAKAHAGVPLVSIRYGGFGVAGRIPVEQGFRILSDPTVARVQVDPGPGPVDCRPVRPRTVPDLDETLGPRLDVLCLLEDGAGVVEGLPGTIGVEMGRVADALVLPLTAVAGSAETGIVALVAGDSVTNVPVELGISDGINIEIRSGVSEGDLVLPWGPDLATAVTW